MRLPLSWLAEWVELGGSVQEVCDHLTNAGIETEIAEDARPNWDGVVTVRLSSVERHPGADRLTVTVPNDGTRDYAVVCGATNHSAGDIVALATVGTVLPGDFKIKKSKIRGELSEGMLCSEKELGLPEMTDGILILPADTPIGCPLSDVIQAGDVILDVSPTANRGDCLSVLGLARELAAVTGWKLLVTEPSSAMSEPTAEGHEVSGSVGLGERAVSVMIADPAGCPHYASAVMENVSIGSSPTWMQQRLEMAGVRPINNVVDCTNYVMMELGNPLHAFDHSFVRGGVVTIRRAGEDERAKTLDGAEHVLSPADLVIADGEGVIALAGVMGGENSEVRDDTTTLFLESAHFDPMTVRKTAHRCKLTTESSYRFARGVDPQLPGRSLSRLIELLVETSGAVVSGDLLDLYPSRPTHPPVGMRIERVSGFLGLDLTRARIIELLERAGLEVDDSSEDLAVQVPSYRFDIEREVDLLEEVARLEGFANVPEVVPNRPLVIVPRQPAGPNIQAVRESMVRLGLSEAIHFSFIDPAWVRDLGLPEDHRWLTHQVAVSNPLSEVGGVLRPTLLPSLLRATARNRAMGAEDIRLFEARRTFAMRDDGFASTLRDEGRPTDRPPVIERRTVAGVLVGRRSAPSWDSNADAVDFFAVKACAEAVVSTLGARGWKWTEKDVPAFLDPRESAVLAGAGGRGSAGWVGRIAVPVLRAFELDTVAWAFELDLDSLAPKRVSVPSFQALSRFPGVERDLAFIVPDSISAGDLLERATKTAKKGLKDAFLGARIFDVYRGKSVPEGTRSVALRFSFRAPDRTLEDKAVDGVMNKVEQQLSQTEGVILRA
jgi:phenylalanyl-tRNA synthetase beta chain